MPEQLTDNEVQELFAELRADELARVIPPGTSAARATVRRRRTMQSVAAGVAVLTVAGGVGAAVAGVGGSLARHNTAANASRDGTTTPSEERSPGPALSRSKLNKYRERAAEAVGVTEEDGPLRSARRANVSATAWYSVVRGSYLLRLACVGGGNLNVTVKTGTVVQDEEGTLHVDQWTAAPQVITTAVPCDKAASIHSMLVEADQDGLMEINVDPDVLAMERAGYAYRAALSSEDASRLHESAKTALPAAIHPTGGAIGSGFASAGMLHEKGSAEPGSYVLRVACSGAGSMVAVVRTSPRRNEKDQGGFVEVARRTAPCSADGRVTEVPFTKNGGGSLEIKLDPDAKADGQAGYAAHLDRR